MENPKVLICDCRCKYGDFDEIILNESRADYLIELGKKLKGL